MSEAAGAPPTRTRREPVELGAARSLRRRRRARAARRRARGRARSRAARPADRRAREGARPVSAPPEAEEGDKARDSSGHTHTHTHTHTHGVGFGVGFGFRFGFRFGFGFGFGFRFGFRFGFGFGFRFGSGSGFGDRFRSRDHRRSRLPTRPEESDPAQEPLRVALLSRAPARRSASVFEPRARAPREGEAVQVGARRSPWDRPGAQALPPHDAGQCGCDPGRDRRGAPRGPGRSREASRSVAAPAAMR